MYSCVMAVASCTDGLSDILQEVSVIDTGIIAQSNGYLMVVCFLLQRYDNPLNLQPVTPYDENTLAVMARVRSQNHPTTNAPILVE